MCHVPTTSHMRFTVLGLKPRQSSKEDKTSCANYDWLNFEQNWRVYTPNWIKRTKTKEQTQHTLPKSSLAGKPACKASSLVWLFCFPTIGRSWQAYNKFINFLPHAEKRFRSNVVILRLDKDSQQRLSPEGSLRWSKYVWDRRLMKETAFLWIGSPNLTSLVATSISCSISLSPRKRSTWYKVILQ